MGSLANAVLEFNQLGLFYSLPPCAAPIRSDAQARQKLKFQRT
jgi:hypothetical protein